MSAGPLSGVRVVDFTENMAGPFGTMILGDQGADVIKVESPNGDALRRRGTGSPDLSSYFANLNRSKRSVCLDLRNQRSAEILQPLLDSADAVVHSFRPAAARRLGVDADTVRGSRPRVIHATVIGFGSAGPWAGRPVYDHVIQATSGMADQQRVDETDAPRLIRHGIVDKTTGHVLAQSVTAALFERTRTQQGTGLEIVMLDVAIALLWPDGMMDHTALAPEVRGPVAALTFQLTPTADGHISLVVLKQQTWANLIAAFNLKDQVPDDAAPSDILRMARGLIKSMTSAEAIELLATHDVPCAPVVAMGEVASHPQVVANQTLVEFTHPVLGPIRQPRPVPAFPGVRATELIGAPLLGANTGEVLAELGFAEAQITSMLDDRVVRSARS